jgi:hypothetical protein
MNDLLREVIQNHRDTHWLDAHADELYQSTRQALRNSRTIHDAATALVLYFPYLLNRDDLRKWNKLAMRTLKVYQSPKNAGQPQRVVNREAFTLPTYAEDHAQPRRPRSERIDQNVMFETYLSLFTSLIFRHPSPILSDLIDSALHFTRRINRQYYYHKLYQLIAFVYNHYGYYDKSADLSQFSYVYWIKHDYPAEAGLSAFALGLAYRGQQDWETSLAWLERAAGLLSETDLTTQYGLVALETGYAQLHHERYAAAIQWSEVALARLSDDHLHYAGLAHEALGLAYCYDEAYDLSLQSLNDAITLWQQNGDLGQQAYTEYLLAYVEAQSGQVEQARSRLQYNLDMWRRVSDSEWKRRMVEKVRHLVNTLR